MPEDARRSPYANGLYDHSRLYGHLAGITLKRAFCPIS